MQIVLNLQGHRLLASIRQTLSSGSKEVDEIKLEVDETWKGFGKIAVFCVGKKCQYTVVDEVTQTAKIPAEVLRNEAVITIGIVGFKDEAVMTSTLVAYQVEKGSVVTIEEPEPSIYAEILSRYADLATELIDARVGADDVVYDTLGEAVRGQVGSLSEEIEKQVGVVTSKMEFVESKNIWGKNEIVDGRYINEDGTVGLNSNCHYMFLNVNSGDKLSQYQWTESQNKYNPYNFTRITAYNESGKAVKELGGQFINNYVVPDRITKIAISSNKLIVDKFITVNDEGNVPTKYEPYYCYYIATDEFTKKEEIIADAVAKAKEEIIVPQKEYNFTPIVLPNGTDIRLDSDKMVCIFTIESISDAVYIMCNVGNNNSKLLYVNWKTGKIGTVITTDVTTIPEQWGYYEDIAIPAVVGRQYSVTVEKLKGVKWVIKLTDLITRKTQEYISDRVYGNGDGYRVVLTSGSLVINDFTVFSTQCSNPKILFIGDSFIAGGQLTNDRSKRYCTLVQDAISEPVFIAGYAGWNSQAIKDIYLSDIKPICKPEYAFLAIGTNDTNYESWLDSMSELIADLKSNGIVPVLVTLTPRTDAAGNNYNANVLPRVNQWVKNSKYKYVDFNSVLISGNETTPNTEYFLSDGVHPNVAGNEVMFEKIKTDIPEWFN